MSKLDELTAELQKQYDLGLEAHEEKTCWEKTEKEHYDKCQLLLAKIELEKLRSKLSSKPEPEWCKDNRLKMKEAELIFSTAYLAMGHSKKFVASVIGVTPQTINNHLIAGTIPLPEVEEQVTQLGLI